MFLKNFSNLGWTTLKNPDKKIYIMKYVNKIIDLGNELSCEKLQEVSA